MRGMLAYKGNLFFVQCKSVKLAKKKLGILYRNIKREKLGKQLKKVTDIYLEIIL